MNYGFNGEQFHSDKDDFLKFITGFLKSFGPSPKKIQGKKIGFIEEMHVRFRLSLVEMGISKIIRAVIAIIVGILVYAILFRPADLTMRLIIVLGFISFYAWLMDEHLVVDGSPVSTTAKLIVNTHEFSSGIVDAAKGFFSGAASILNPFSKQK